MLAGKGCGTETRLTFSIITKVKKLVGPLCKDSKRILDKSDDDQEASNRGKIPVKKGMMLAQPLEGSNSPLIANINIRFNRISHCIEPVLDLASLLADRVQRTRIVRCIIPPRPAEGVLVAEVVARCAANLGHSGVDGLEYEIY